MQAEEKGQIVEAMNMRSSIYGLLYTVYVRELTQEQIEAFAKFDYDALSDIDPVIAEGAHELKRYFKRMRSEMREDLAVDYAHMFYAAGSSKHERRAVPYESVYTSPEGLLMQDARDQVYKYMLAEHVEPDPDLHVPEDHVAFIFDFMATLAKRTVDALQADDLSEAARLIEVQHGFHREHIANWIGDLCDSMDSCHRTKFYGGFSKIVRGWSAIDGGILDELSEEAARVA